VLVSAAYVYTHISIYTYVDMYIYLYLNIYTHTYTNTSHTCHTSQVWCTTHTLKCALEGVFCLGVHLCPEIHEPKVEPAIEAVAAPLGYSLPTRLALMHVCVYLGVYMCAYNIHACACAQSACATHAFEPRKEGLEENESVKTPTTSAVRSIFSRSA